MKSYSNCSKSYSYSKTMERLDTTQGLSLQIINEKKLLVTLLLSSGIPDDIYNFCKIVHIETHHGVFEIFYKCEQFIPIVRTINGAWYYIGNIKTTIHEILTHFGCAHFVIRDAFDYQTNKIVPSNDMLYAPVCSSYMLTLVEPLVKS